MESKVTDWKIDSIKILAQNTVIPFLKSHKVKDDICSICRCHFDENSLNNKSRLKRDEIAIGKCGHCFHKCCISNWLREQNTCPICAKKWEFLIVSDINSIRSKLELPISPINIPKKEPEFESADLEEKMEEFEVSWGEVEQGNVNEIQEAETETDEIETDSDDSMPPLEE